ncbi:hypothetical protein BB560_001766 [Smittium megazygosporum]|uniref:Uncharacterized protein n=1 Tax=Smittium megazygosporum TaxID=133381 RepID=A0A2T9ZGM2_9FUNG|nr:hypothetical protein BB560_001766 [Smittium megazygosporum]
MEPSVVFEAGWDNLEKPKTSLEKLSYDNFILKCPNGIYTSARTIDFSGVISLDSHLNRLAKSLSVLINLSPEKKASFAGKYKEVMGKDDFDECFDPGFWEKALVPWIRDGLIKFKEEVLLKRESAVDEKESEAPVPKKIKVDPESTKNQSSALCNGTNLLSEVKISFSISVDPLLVRMHMTKFTAFSKNNQEIMLARGIRDNPTAKYSQWVEDRKPLEEMISPPINEVVLYSHTSFACTEGISSNFFVVERKIPDEDNLSHDLNSTSEEENLSDLIDTYRVVTSPTEKVLIGTIMQVVLKVCKEDGIEVSYREPSISDLQTDRWEGVFITSTSRLVLPIVAVNIRNIKNKIGINNCPLVEHIRKRVTEQVRLDSYKVL